MTDIYLVRHGATAWNRSMPYRLQGRKTDLPLDRLGVEQARAVSNALARAGSRLAAVYCSPLLRALQTAEILAEAHGVTPLVSEALIEADLGRWEGRTWEEIAETEPEDFRRFMANPGTVPYPAGESFLDVQRRALPAIERLAAAHNGRAIAVVGHNVVNRAVLALPLGLSIDRARGLRQDNGGINILRHDEGVLRVRTLNATFHLHDLATDG
jgi:broad specificity phosphatase PhoE